MNHVSIRFLIGLARGSDIAPMTEGCANDRADAIRRLLGAAYDAATSYRTLGYWKGAAEPSMVWEVILPDSPTARTVARAHASMLAEVFEQDAIGLAFSPVTFELHGKDGIQ
jgi:hypothetical protein